MRDARGEAAVWVAPTDHPGGVRVLEPSPPADTSPPWFADDPLEGGEILPVRRPGARTWQDVCLQRGDTALVTFCLERWLGPWRRLEVLPAAFGPTRAGLHAMAQHVLCPLRHQANGRIGLRWTIGGFGTPFLPGDRQVRIERGELVDGDRRSSLTTLGDAARFVGITPGAPAGIFEPTTPCRPDGPLGVDRVAASALGDWFGFATSVLEQLRAEAGADERPGRVQLWPEHFDIAVQLGPEGHEANYGASPGDAAHPEPYLYVGPWSARVGTFWNEPFGAAQPYSALLGAVDQRATALAFLREGRHLLSGPS
jgi:hypothetical protein